MTSIESLSDQITQSQVGYVTDSYSMSIGEFMSMYSSGELFINPKYQREFRWSIQQKSRFIESILLGIPLPSVFIFQDKKQWEVVDGLQRLSTIFQYTGILKDKLGNLISTQDGEDLMPFKVSDVKTLILLNDKKWEDFDDELKFVFRKTKMDVKIVKIKSEEGKRAKFELFQRLNQRPSILSGQEYRNALFIMYDESLFDWLDELSKYPNFIYCISGLESRWIKEQYDKELILRLFTFPLFELKSKFKKVDDYLDNAIFYDDNSLLKCISNSQFDLNNEKNKFKKTFDLLYEIKGEEVFKSNTSSRGQQFLESYFEAIAIGLYYNIDSYGIDNKDDLELIEKKIDDIENQEDFQNARGSGTNTEVRIKKLVPFSKKYFSKDE